MIAGGAPVEYHRGELRKKLLDLVSRVANILTSRRSFDKVVGKINIKYIEGKNCEDI